MARVFDELQVAEVQDRYPHLHLQGVDRLSGTLDLSASYEFTELHDSYQVTISGHNPNSIHLPSLIEVGGRTDQILSKWQLADPRILHRNPDGTACVCAKQA